MTIQKVDFEDKKNKILSRNHIPMVLDVVFYLFIGLIFGSGASLVVTLLFNAELRMNIIAVLVILISVITVISIILRYLNFMNTKYIIHSGFVAISENFIQTDTTEIIMEEGIFWRVRRIYKESQFQRVVLRQGIFGKIFNYGNLELKHDLNNFSRVLRNVSNPIKVQAEIQRIFDRIIEQNMLKGDMKFETPKSQESVQEIKSAV